MTSQLPKTSTKGNALVFLLWVAAMLGIVVTLTEARSNSIANRDFVSFWVSGKLAGSGQAGKAYDVVALRAEAAREAGTTASIAYPYPPHLFFLTVPLSLMPLSVAYIVWIVGTAMLFAFAARPYLPPGFSPWLAISTPAAIWTVVFGQTGFLYGALWLLAFSGSALAAALLTVKPHLGVLVGIEVVRRRRFLRTSLLLAAILLMSVLVFGTDSWRACFVALRQNHLKWVDSGTYGVWYFQMTTPYLGYGLAAWLGFAVAAILLLKRRFDAFTAATAAFLIAPYGFHYDMTVICLGFGIALFESWRQMRPWHTFVCALAFLSPVIVRAGTWLVPPILLIGLYALTARKLGDASGKDDRSRLGGSLPADRQRSALPSLEKAAA